MNRLSGGCVGDVSAVALDDGRRLVIKSGDGDAGLDIEGRMLRYLGDHSDLAVPNVIHADADLLIMEKFPNDGRINSVTEQQAAREIAALHQVTW
ncbi:hypothetical protein RYZ26_19105 [Terasakiella sp. A23]|uniref:hypothetical protein n=1 Tax=Terasakiella sp. FCG-A23 TaxID=3080561 RepID=UPI002954B064|nr:hypothetical protein [Terasakiella sp. A23]MDV7341718.1 hypothetical protein [Terasakiella sp. A23]